MKTKINWWYYMSILFIVLLLIGTLHSIPVHAQSEQKTVRVAYPIQEGITDLDNKGNYTGYTYEYLEEIAQYTGWNYEFIQVEGTVDEQIIKLMEMLQNGEVDIMGAMLYSEQLDETYDFSSYSYGTVETVLQVLTGKEQSLVIDSSREQTMRIAVRSLNGNQINDLKEFCQMNLIDPILILYGSEEETVQALQNGEVDAMLTTSMYFNQSMRTIARFSPKQFYFASSEGKNDILTELNEAMLNLHQIDPYFQSTLYDKYFAPKIYNLSLNTNEKGYIDKIKNLNVGVLTNLPPFQYKDNGDLSGISLEVLNYIAEKTGLTFTYIEADSQQSLYQMLEDGSIDIIANMPYDYATAAKQNISMTRPYVNSQHILLLNSSITNNNLNEKTLASLTDNEFFQDLDVNKKNYDTIEECIEAVENGDADYTYVDMYIAQYFINLPEFDNLKMVPQNNASSLTCFGISASANRTLYNIINKVIVSIPEEELQSIININSLQKEAFSIDVFIKKNPLQSIGILLTGFLILVSLLLYILYQRNKAAKASALELQRHMRLYAVTKDIIFEYDYQKLELMLSIPENKTDEKQIQHYSFHDPINTVEEMKSKETILNILNKKENGIFEVELFTSDQKWHWYNIVLEVILGEDHEPVYALGRLNQIDAQRKERNELIDKANKDSLTQLYNSESSKSQIQDMLADAKLKTGALMILDIDNFKSINDTCGHLTGDDMLRQVSKFLSNHFRNHDIIGRPGGDEFLIYMPYINSKDDLKRKCQLICEGIHDIKLPTQASLTMSVGAVLSNGNHTYEELYEAADKALYQAKDSGRNQYHIVDIEETGNDQ